jgi:hypothetical protein
MIPIPAYDYKWFSYYIQGQASFLSACRFFNVDPIEAKAGVDRAIATIEMNEKEFFMLEEARKSRRKKRPRSRA